VLSITVTNPGGLSWPVWAGLVTQELLGGYNLPNPGNEGLWQLWATELLNIPGLVELGLPDPRTFGKNWRGWATVFTLIVT